MNESKPNRWISKAGMPRLEGSEMKWAGSRIYGSKDFLKLKLGDPTVQMYFEFVSDNEGKLHNGKTSLKPL